VPIDTNEKGEAAFEAKANEILKKVLLPAICGDALRAFATYQRALSATESGCCVDATRASAVAVAVWTSWCCRKGRRV
jgi:hypothetical protein